jgi:hypothetical protein
VSLNANAFDYAMQCLDDAAPPYFVLLPETNLGSVYRGDTIILPVWEARDQRGVLIPLTSASIWFTAKVDLSDADHEPPTIQRSTAAGGVVVVDADLGLYQITVNALDTQNLEGDTAFLFDVQVHTITSIVATVKRGVLTVVEDVTRTYA